MDKVFMLSTENKFGIDEFHRLKKVSVHRPDTSIKLITKDNYKYFLFEYQPDVDKYLQEHNKYTHLLKSHDVEVFELSQYVHRNSDLLDRLPNLAYMHDIAVASKHGAILSKMSSGGRQHEELVVMEALRNMGMPILYEFSEGDQFESFLILSPRTIFVANTERHSRKSIKKFIQFMLGYYEEIIYVEVPQERRFMHADMFCSRMTENLIMAYLPAFLQSWHITRQGQEEVDFKKFMNSRMIDVISISDDEQRKWGCSFVALEPGAIINYDISLNQQTINTLENEGIKFIHFHPEALLAGGGSLRCLTLKIWRE